METFEETKFYHPSKARINDKTFKKIKLDEYYTTMDDDRYVDLLFRKYRFMFRV